MKALIIILSSPFSMPFSRSPRPLPTSAPHTPALATEVGTGLWRMGKPPLVVIDREGTGASERGQGALRPSPLLCTPGSLSSLLGSGLGGTSTWVVSTAQSHRRQPSRLTGAREAGDGEEQSRGLSVCWEAAAAPWHVGTAGCASTQGCHWLARVGVGHSL